MGDFELIIGLLAIVVVLAACAYRLSLPYPMLLLVFGAAIALMPGMREVELDPHLALALFLPPVLFEAAYFTSWRDFKANAPSIGGLAIGGVLVTTVIVAVIAHEIFAGMPWAVAFALGAIVSPPDAVAASTIFRRLGAPHRVTTILEGESLVNDASALVTYRVAVAAILTGTFSWGEAAGEFLVTSVGGVILGVAAGHLVTAAIRWLQTTDLEIAATLIVPFLIYGGAEELHVSGVLAVVTAGLIFGRGASRALSSASRLGGVTTWQAGLILVNGTAFILIGLELRVILGDLSGSDILDLLVKSLAISLGVIAARFIWMYPFATIKHGFLNWRQISYPQQSRAASFIIGWSGLRGIVSLASALSLPLVDDAGIPVPYRNEVLFITFVVICATLLGQGLPLPWLLRKLGLHDDGEVKRETVAAWRIALQACIDRLLELEGEAWVPSDHIEEMRHRFQHMLDTIFEDGDGLQIDRAHVEASRQLQEDVIETARSALLDARNRGVIGDAARIKVEADLDLELLRFAA